MSNLKEARGDEHYSKLFVMGLCSRFERSFLPPNVQGLSTSIDFGKSRVDFYMKRHSDRPYINFTLSTTPDNRELLALGVGMEKALEPYKELGVDMVHIIIQPDPKSSVVRLYAEDKRGWPVRFLSELANDAVGIGIGVIPGKRKLKVLGGESGKRHMEMVEFLEQAIVLNFGENEPSGLQVLERLIKERK